MLFELCILSLCQFIDFVVVGYLEAIVSIKKDSINGLIFLSCDSQIQA